MAKKTNETITVESSRKTLHAAQRAYGNIVRKPVVNMSAAELEKHTKDCREAIMAKRRAGIILDALQHNKPIPDADDAIETRKVK
jgi:hypothetical protein